LHHFFINRIPNSIYHKTISPFPALQNKKRQLALALDR
jgi:hypothetical protein